MDETSGPRLAASSTNDLTDNNTVGSAPGIINDGADFERDNSEYLSITDGAQTGLDFTGNVFTFSFWWIPEDLPTSGPGQFFLWKGSNPDRSYGMWYEPSVPGYWRLMWMNAAQVERDCDWNGTGPVASTGNPLYIVASWDTLNASTTLVVNGTSYGTKTCGPGAALNNSTGDFDVAGILGGGYLDGIVDEMGAWNRTLTTSEIAQLYNAGLGLCFDCSSGGTSTIALPAPGGSMFNMLASSTCSTVATSTVCTYGYSTTTPTVDMPVVGIALGAMIFLAAMYLMIGIVKNVRHVHVSRD